MRARSIRSGAHLVVGTLWSSEGRFVQAHHGIVDGACDASLGYDERQNVASEEPRRRNLALVEGSVGRRKLRVERAESDRGTPQQQPRDKDVAERVEQPG